MVAPHTNTNTLKTSLPSACEEAQQWVAADLTNESIPAHVHEHLKSCEACTETQIAFKEIWPVLGKSLNASASITKINSNRFAGKPESIQTLITNFEKRKSRKNRSIQALSMAAGFLLGVGLMFGWTRINPLESTSADAQKGNKADQHAAKDQSIQALEAERQALKRSNETKSGTVKNPKSITELLDLSKTQRIQISYDAGGSRDSKHVLERSISNPEKISQWVDILSCIHPKGSIAGFDKIGRSQCKIVFLGTNQQRNELQVKADKLVSPLASASSNATFYPNSEDSEFIWLVRQALASEPLPAWGSLKAGLKTRLMTNKKKYAKGESIELWLELRNETSRLLKFHVPSNLLEAELFVVTTAQGKKMTALEQPFFDQETSAQIKSNSKILFMRPIDLSCYFDLSTKGRYKIQFLGEQSIKGGKQVVPGSNALEIEITE